MYVITCNIPSACVDRSPQDECYMRIHDASDTADVLTANATESSFPDWVSRPPWLHGWHGFVSKSCVLKFDGLSWFYLLTLLIWYKSKYPLFVHTQILRSTDSFLTAPDFPKNMPSRTHTCLGGPSHQISPILEFFHRHWRTGILGLYRMFLSRQPLPWMPAVLGFQTLTSSEMYRNVMFTLKRRQRMCIETTNSSGWVCLSTGCRWVPRKPVDHGIYYIPRFQT